VNCTVIARKRAIILFNNETYYLASGKEASGACWLLSAVLSESKQYLHISAVACIIENEKVDARRSRYLLEVL